MRVDVDKKHSLFWHDQTFDLYVLKFKDKDSFAIVIKPKEGKPQSAFLTGNEFSSFVCELVKYCLDLPIVAREIPCPITCVDKPHGCFREMLMIKDEMGREGIKCDERWLKYHGTDEFLAELREDGKLVLSAINSKAVKERKCPYCGSVLWRNQDEGKRT